MTSMKSYWEPWCLSEPVVEEWFLLNYWRLGFDRIQVSSPGDYKVWICDKEYVVELEGYSPATWNHRDYTIDQFDYVICYKASKKDRIRIPARGIKLIELYPDWMQFEFSPQQIVSSIIRRINNRNALLNYKFGDHVEHT